MLKRASRRFARRSNGRTTSSPTTRSGCSRGSSVFAGGCTLDAADEIVEADVDGLQSLVDKSLVRRTGERFWMLETIGEFAREHLEASDDADAIGRRHAEWFLALAEEAEPYLKGAEQASWLQRLEDEHDNLRASLDWFFDHGDVEGAVRLAGTLWLFWYMHGHVTEARRWMRRALDVAPDEPSAARAHLLYGAGYLACEQNENEEGIALLEASLCMREGGRSNRDGRDRRGRPVLHAGRDHAVARQIVGRQWPWARKRSLSRARQATTSCSRSHSTTSAG